MTTQTKISGSDLDSMLKRVGIELKKNSEIQHELLKATSQYRNAVDNLSAASDKLAQVVGKFAVNAMSSFQTGKEYNLLSGNSVSADIETKQRNLNLALQQVVKFHTFMSQQQQNISHSLTVDFEKPIHSNLVSYKEMMLAWDRDCEREIKRLQHDIKLKESEATKAGKKMASKDMSKLSSSLAELSIKIAELNKMRQERIESAVVTNSHHYFLIAHHLQQVLKAEIQACRNLYYQDDLRKKPSFTQLDSLTANHKKSPVMTPSPLSNPTRVTSPMSPPLIHNQPIQKEPTLNAPMAPVRRTSLDDDKENKSPPQAPQVQRRVFEDNNPPPMPKNPHRATQVIPQGLTPQDLNSFFESNFGLEEAETLRRGQIRDSILPAKVDRDSIFRKSKFDRDSIFTKTIYDSADHSFKATVKGKYSTLRKSLFPTDDPEDSDLVLVLYDYVGAEMDDLNVIEGDILRVIAVEGEWLYGLLLVPTAPGSNDFIPAEVNGQHQVGWVPVSFTTVLDD